MDNDRRCASVIISPRTRLFSAWTRPRLSFHASFPPSRGDGEEARLLVLSALVLSLAVSRAGGASRGGVSGVAPRFLPLSRRFISRTAPSASHSSTALTSHGHVKRKMPELKLPISDTGALTNAWGCPCMHRVRLATPTAFTGCSSWRFEITSSSDAEGGRRPATMEPMGRAAVEAVEAVDVEGVELAQKQELVEQEQGQHAVVPAGAAVLVTAELGFWQQLHQPSFWHLVLFFGKLAEQPQPSATNNPHEHMDGWLVGVVGGSAHSVTLVVQPTTSPGTSGCWVPGRTSSSRLVGAVWLVVICLSAWSNRMTVLPSAHIRGCR